MADEPGRADQPDGDEEEPASRPGKARKWDWRTNARNDPIGIVEVRHGYEEDAVEGPGGTQSPGPPPDALDEGHAGGAAGGPPGIPPDAATPDPVEALFARAEKDRQPPSKGRTAEHGPDATPHPELLGSRSRRPARVRREHRRPTRRAGKAMVGLFAAVVLIAVGATVFATSGSGPPHPPGSTATTTTVAHHAVTPVNPKVVSIVASLARIMDAANVTFTGQLATAGSTPSLAQVSAAVTPYATDVKNYEFELHVVDWPARMAGVIRTMYAQLEAYNEYLQSFHSTGPATLASWLAQLDPHGTAVQVADNAMRHDLGLPASHLFP